MTLDHPVVMLPSIQPCPVTSHDALGFSSPHLFHSPCVYITTGYHQILSSDNRVCSFLSLYVNQWWQMAAPP